VDALHPLVLQPAVVDQKSQLDMRNCQQADQQTAGQASRDPLRSKRNRPLDEFRLLAFRFHQRFLQPDSSTDSSARRAVLPRIERTGDWANNRPA
jgi:hypothetical protein